jgi:ATP-binding cassette subfamily F protein 3
MEAARRSGDRVLETHDLVIGYEEPLFAVPDLVLTRGECAALIGPNGAGKTTFLRTLLGEVPAHAGTARLGAGLQIGYFAQTHQGLDPEQTLLQALQAAAPDLTQQEARDFLARYLFTGDAVEKPVGALSGGERGRLALGLLSLQGSNLLLLDEPTNHLDLPSQEVLQEALAAFAGTTLLVSHDRYLIDALATQVWAVSPEGRRLDVFVGGYGAYLEAREQEAEQARPTERARRAKPVGRPKSVEAARALEAAEAHVSRLEKELAQTGRELEAAGPDAGRVAALGTRYAEVQQALEEAFAAWERLARGDARSV